MDNWNQTTGYQTPMQVENEISLKKYIGAVMNKVYGKMFLGLMVTAIASFIVSSSPALLSLIFANRMVMWILFAIEIGMVIYLSARIDKMSSGTATALFYVYSLLNGVVLSPIFLAYTSTSIATTFAITAGTFGAMSLFGYVTKQDLSKFGSFLFMALIGLIICVIVNMFLHNSTFDLIISCAGVLIFVGLTAWDTQAIKRMSAEADPSMVGKIATMGALSLYLDFINLFLYLLRFFGASRD